MGFINENVLVSIVMAVFNGERYLANQLDSILNQTYKNIEIIIVDDASSDNTISIINAYCSVHKNISLIQNSANVGIVKSFEIAMTMSTGEYIALSDQDDIWFSHKIEKLIGSIDDALLIHSDAVLVDESMQIIAKTNFGLTGKDKSKSEFIDYLISNNVTGCTALFPRKLLKLALPIPDGFYIHDHYLALIASFYGNIKFLDEPLVYYRQHGNNAIGAKRPHFDKFIEHCKVIANSYSILLTLPAFKDNTLIQLMHDYRSSLYLRKWTSSFNLLRLIKIKHGIKLLIYYLLLGGIFNYGISRKIYNYLYNV